MKTLIYICTMLLGLAAVGWTQTPLSSIATDDDPNAPWHITADTISYDDHLKRYTASGNVVIQKENRRLTADQVFFDQINMQAKASGNIVLTVGQDYLLGQRAEIDLRRETGSIYGGTLFVAASHFYIKGDKIQKTGPETYTVDQGSFTACDGDQPAWRITGRNLKVTVEGFGTVQHATLWARKVPVVYAPYLVFPVKLKRQTGLLPPEMGFSDRKGETYLQPFFWAINQQSDATLYLDHMGRRGEKLGLEYRYALSRDTQGAIMYDFFNDRRIDDGLGDNSRYYGYTDDAVLRTNSDRYWLRLKHDQSLPFNFVGQLDVDVVSDQDYLQEFSGGYTGYHATNDYFLKTFGRTLDDINDPVRVSRLNLTRNWSQFSLVGETRWYDDVVVRRSGAADTTIQMLPWVELNGTRQRLLKTPFYFDLDSQYQYFYRDQGARTHRADVNPRIYWPLKFKNYLTFEPSLGLRETVWLSEKDPSVNERYPLSRTLYDVKLDFFSDLNRVYNLKSNDNDGISADRLKHIIRPQILYNYIPSLNQDRYPSFDDIDRIGPANLITYSLTNFLIARYPVKARPNNRTNEPQASHDYRQMARFKVEQSYDIDIAKSNDPRPFTDVLAELELEIAPAWHVKADTTWSPYGYGFSSRNLAMQVADKRGDSLSLEYRYLENDYESIRGDVGVQITDRLKAFSDYEHNIKAGKMIEMNLGFQYKAQCWTVKMGYGEEGEFRTRKYALWIVLHGLGGFGTN